MGFLPRYVNLSTFSISISPISFYRVLSNTIAYALSIFISNRHIVFTAQLIHIHFLQFNRVYIDYKFHVCISKSHSASSALLSKFFVIKVRRRRAAHSAVQRIEMFTILFTNSSIV